MNGLNHSICFLSPARRLRPRDILTVPQRALIPYESPGPNSVVYQDLTGSGAETIAHVQENDRILIMLCSFTGPPQIVRFHGKGSVHRIGSEGYAHYEKLFPKRVDCRAFIAVDVTRIGTSCGYSVPLYEYAGQRDVLDKWAEKKGADGLVAYREKKNRQSIDGLPALS